MIELGKMERVEDLRTVWKHELQDFSKWLSQEENLELLSDTIGINLVLTELESSVGSFNVDLYAEEKGTGKKIIIENQLEDTNHDHLGKIITYASGKGADVIVWIVKRARDEHKQAIEWLNRNTDENIGFFLLELELWKINGSLPAPKFNVVERPNDWTKIMKRSENLSATKKIQLEFWQEFNEYAFSKPEFKKVFSSRKASPQHWYSLNVGNSSLHIDLSVNTQKNCISADIYVDDNKELFENFKAHKAEIEEKLGIEMTWKIAKKDCRIFTSRNCNIKKSKNSWNSHFSWFCDVALKLKDIIKKYAEL